MPKSKKTKQKYQDFQKVKLKVGKRLPKGANETTTAFQSRAILVKEQLKGTDSDQPTTRRKLNLSELFGQCRHYSAGVRHEAVMGIKELITTNPSILQSSMAAILERMSEFFLDKDQNVRQAVVKTLKVVFPFISIDQISPFFGVISAHLCCAMTHIYEDIQLDSLSILDLFLENYPVLVTSSSNQLLQNFIEQISRKSHGKDGNSNDKARSLLVNPNSKLSSQKWRIKVLGRLHRFLYALMQSVNANAHKSSQRTSGCSRNGAPTSYLSYDCFERNYLEGYKISKNQAPGKGQLDIMNDPEQLKSFVQVLIPLLFECWIECGPSQLATSLPGNALGIDTMTTLASILNVLQLLLQYVDQISGDFQEVSIQWIKDNYMRDFLHYFLPYFPYSMHEVQPRGKQKKAETPQVSVLSLNLSLCEIVSFFMVPFDASEDVVEVRGDWEEKVMQYISNDVCQAKLSPEQVETMLRVMKHIVNSFKDEETVEKMLSSLHHLLERRHPSSKETLVIHQFFADLAFLEEGHFYCSLKIMKKWLGTLPNVLLKLTQSKDTVLQYLKIMQRAGSQQEPTYLHALQKSLPRMLDGEAITGFPQDVQVQVVEMMYWLPAIGSELCQQMAHLINTQLLELNAASYFLEIIHSKYSRDVNKQEITSGNYLKFLFTVLTGYSQDDIKSVQSEEDSMFKYKILEITSNPTRWSYRRMIVENILKTLQKFENDRQIGTVVLSNVQHLMAHMSSLPVDMVFSMTQILLMKSLIHDGKDYSQESQKLLAKLTVACLFWCTKENLTQMTVEETDIEIAGATVNTATRSVIKIDLYNSVVTLLSKSHWLFTETLICIHEMVSTDGFNMANVETLTLVLKNLLLQKTVRDRFYEEIMKLEQIKALILNCQPQVEAKQWFVNFDYEVTLITRREEDMQAQ